MKKIQRRPFLIACAAATVAPLTSFEARAADSAKGQRDYYELRQYTFEKDEQKRGFDSFMRDAAIPALNRIGINPVGVFYPLEGSSLAYVLLRHKSLNSVATLGQQLASDEDFLSRSAAFLDAPAEAPAYKRFESSLLISFAGMPELEQPVKTAKRVLQLRIYESPSEKTGLKKIEMFNDAGEIKIFREVGLRPVFFGQTLVGSKQPNLTYMLAFESEDELKANWNKFRTHPEWLKLRAMPEYADKKIVSGITNIVLRPAEYSQV
jgi:hypothetical protein